MERNRVEIDARVVSSAGLRHTPGGIACLELRLAHGSEQTEAGRKRRVECELDAVAFGPPAQALAGLKTGDAVRLNGFLERKGVRDPRSILHVTEFELIQGATNGFLPS